MSTWQQTQIRIDTKKWGQTKAFSQKKVAITTKKPGKFYFSSVEEKRVGTKSRVGAQPEAEEIAMHKVRTRWESGIPATSPNKLPSAANQISTGNKILSALSGRE